MLLHSSSFLFQNNADLFNTFDQFDTLLIHQFIIIIQIANKESKINSYFQILPLKPFEFHFHILLDIFFVGLFLYHFE